MRTTRIAKIVGVAAAIPMLMTATAGNASAAAYGNTLSQGEQLTAGQWIAQNSSDPAVFWELDMQTDGNLVEYKTDHNQGTREVCWASNTMNSGATHVVYQRDGNFVLYTDSGTPKWASDTRGGGGSTVSFNYSGVIYVGYSQVAGGC
ncbi:hypothetical protein [Streptacidiphilus sp. EB129]|uniref:hypothetical protein n=1 Tax=Streptacidiphilus sp. EB129 TaxID=3156262 RepID=UPI0035111F82